METGISSASPCKRRRIAFMSLISRDLDDVRLFLHITYERYYSVPVGRVENIPLPRCELYEKDNL